MFCAPQLLLDVKEYAGFQCDRAAVFGAAINERPVNDDRLFCNRTFHFWYLKGWD